MMVQNFMASLPNTHFFMHDFNLARNFNQEALSKLLISVFPIHSILFYFGNLYAILDKLSEAGVTLTFHRAYNSLIGLTGYTLKTGSDAQLMSIAERWGYRIDQYTDFDPTSFNTVIPVTAPILSDALAAPAQNPYQAQGLTAASSAGPSSSNA